MRSSIFYTGAGGFALGIFTRSFWDVSLEGVMSLALGGALLAFIAHWFEKGRRGVFFFFSLILVTAALGMVRFDISTWNERSVVFDSRIEREVVLEGVVKKEVEVRETTTHVTLSVERIDDVVDERNVLLITERHEEVSFGDRLRVTGVLDIPTSFETDFGRTFNYPGYLSARGITYTLFFPREIEKIESGEGNVILSSLLTLKHSFMERLEAVLHEPQAGLGEGLLLGVKRALGEDLEEAFRRVGIIHIVVLSGYNVTIVAEAIMRLLSAFFMPRTRMVFGVIAIAAFAFITGLSATVLRASLMAVLVLVARATGRVYVVMRALTLAGLVMLLFNPKLLAFDPGFQLSFLATAGLILLQPLIEARFKLVPTRFQIREFVTATIATQIFVLPLLLYSIGEFSVVSVVANVLVLPAVPLAMLLAFVTGALGWVSVSLALIPGYFAHFVLTYIVEVAELLSALPFAAFLVPAFPFWVVVVSYGVLGVFIVRYCRENHSSSEYKKGGALGR